MAKNNKGILYGVGVGPGDPELLTLKAHRIINEADVLAYPAPEDGDGLALEIVRPLPPDGPALFFRRRFEAVLIQNTIH